MNFRILSYLNAIRLEYNVLMIKIYKETELNFVEY